MSEEIGQGLFLAHDAKPIKSGDLVLCYHGVLNNSEDIEFSDYKSCISPAFAHESLF